MKQWILLTPERADSVWIQTEGDFYTYEIAPEPKIKKSDEVYLWSKSHNSFYGWGVVAETPQIVTMEIPRHDNEIQKLRRQSVVVNRQKEFYPPITNYMMSRDRNLKKLIPDGFNDFLALPLRPGQAASINDFIRAFHLDAPRQSTTVGWTVLDEAPDITVQSIVTLGEKTSEGRVVELVRPAWDVIVEVISRDPNEILNIDPRKFEELIAGAYVKDGYDVELTPRSGDKGRDVVATRPGFGSVRIFDQVKRYKVSRPVTAEEVRALVGTITMAGNVSKGVITTSSTFAPNLLKDPDIARLVPHRLELRAKDDLLRWLTGIRRYR